MAIEYRILDESFVGIARLFDYGTYPPRLDEEDEEQERSRLLAAGLYGGTPGRRPQTSTRFRPMGPRIKLDERAEDLWVQDAEIIAPPRAPPRATPPPMAPRSATRALPQNLPMLARPQTGPVSQQAPVTPGQAVNELLATLNELAIAAGLDPSVFTDMQSVDAIDVSDVFNDMR